MSTEVEELKNLNEDITDGDQKTQLVGSDGTAVTVLNNPETSNNELLVNLEGHICTDNTTSTPLAEDATFTGGWQDTKNYGVISIAIKSDKASATDGLVVEWSPDQIVVADTDKFTLSANVGKVFTFGPASRYVRVKYTNGAAAQTTFNLETLLRRVYVKPSSHRINDSIVAQDDAELVKAVLTGENPGGTFVNFQATTAGNFKVSLEEYDSATTPYRTNLEGGGKVAVGTTAIEATFTGSTKSIIITADIDNSGVLYVGKSDVASDGSNALTFLMPGYRYWQQCNQPPLSWMRSYC